MNKWSHPKLANITTGGIIILIIIISIFANDIREGKYNPTYEIHLQGSKIDFYSVTIQQELTNGTVIEKNIPRDIVFQTTLSTKSLSAQLPIHVTAVSEPFNTISDWEYAQLPDSLILIFPDSLKYPLEDLGDLSYNGGYIQTYLNHKTKQYEGNNYIEYQFASDGGFYLQMPQLMKGQFEKNLDGTITISALEIGDSQERVLTPTRFPVEPLSATINLQMNNLVQAISVLIINVALIQSRKQIIYGVIFCFIPIRNSVFRIIKKLKTIRHNFS